MGEREPLPLIGQQPPERADAARNRQKIIDVAVRMLATCGADRLSLDVVAREAGVGVGTVYRRFGDRSGLAYALLDERERRFQAAFMTGEPPLGPGAPPAERIIAFLHALVDFTLELQDLFLLLEQGKPKSRFSGPYRVHHTHLAALIGQLRPDSDPRFLAGALLAPVNANLLDFQLTTMGMTTEVIKAGITDLVTALAGEG